MLLVYAEEYIVEYLDRLIPLMLKIYSTSENEEFGKESKEKTNSCFKLIGRYCSFKSFNSLIHKYLVGELSTNEEVFVNALIGYKNLIDGYLEAIPENSGMLDKKHSVIEIIKNMGESSWLDNLSRYSLQEFQKLFFVIFKTIFDKSTETEVKVII